MTDSALQFGMNIFLSALQEAKHFAPDVFSTPRPLLREIRAVFNDEYTYEYKEAVSRVTSRYAMAFGPVDKERDYSMFPALIACASWHADHVLLEYDGIFESAKEEAPSVREGAIAAFFLISVFALLIEEAFDLSEGDVPEEKHFREAYRHFISRRNGDLVTNQLIVPIHGMELPTGCREIELSDTMRMVSLTAAEKNSGWYWSFRDFTSTNAAQLANSRIALVVDETSKTTADSRDVASTFLTALRLVPAVEFRAPDTFQKPMYRSLVIGGTGALPDFGPIPAGIPRAISTLSIEQLTEAGRLFRQLSALLALKVKGLETPLGRYCTSFVRERDEDALLDLVVALECLLLPTNKDSELAFRFRINAVLLLPRDLPVPEKKQALKVFDALYSARSAVVHKGKSVDGCLADVTSKTGIKSWHEFYVQAQRLAVTVIKGFLGMLRDHPSIDAVQAHLLQIAAGIERE